MAGQMYPLIIAAASIGVFHTLLGPDHYLPFIMMSWSRRWSRMKTAMITLACGLGHIGSSVLLGLIGVALVLEVKRLEVVESVRGNVAAWLLIGFGLVYFVWGMRRALRKRPHEHSHAHPVGTSHTHTHTHEAEHAHIHDDKSRTAPWALFVIFIFGPCEPLIPVLMYPAAKSSLTGLVLVTLVFGAATIGTMMGLVMLSTTGLNFIPLKRVEPFSHAIAGGTICLCGLAIQFLEL
ncbi:MAG: urease accessory protein UreH domain-containing protein [Planctomycetota bacterium]